MTIIAQGEICDIDGQCVDAGDDELFKLTTKGGKMSVEREKARPPFVNLWGACCMNPKENHWTT